MQSRSDFPIATQLFLNLSQIRGLERAALLPIDGIGLLRSELAIVSMLDQQPLAWWLNGSRKNDFVKCLSEQILQFARAFFPRPVFYRSSDWRSRELSPDSGESTEGGNPILGRRGTLTYTLAPALFEAELAALARVQALGYANVRLILPFVRALEEVVFCRELIENIGLNQYPNFQLWIMAEVPSVSYMLPEYVKAGVQGISIGTNDLTQLLLGVDRERAELARLFDERHPAVLNTVRQLIEQSRSLGIPCSICGQAPVVYPEIIDLLVQWGISAISVEAGAVEKTYLAIARAEQRLMLEAARKGR
nr:putative PEP-binding protein [Oscillatoria sp. FACHB-1406]